MRVEIRPSQAGACDTDVKDRMRAPSRGRRRWETIQCIVARMLQRDRSDSCTAGPWASPPDACADHPSQLGAGDAEKTGLLGRALHACELRLPAPSCPRFVRSIPRSHTGWSPKLGGWGYHICNTMTGPATTHVWHCHWLPGRHGLFSNIGHHAISRRSSQWGIDKREAISD